MTKETFRMFLDSIEAVSANLDDIPDDMLPELLALAQQFAYLVRTESEERVTPEEEESNPVSDYYRDEELSFISSH